MYGLEMAKGLMVTLKNMTKKPFTVQYPEERLKQHPRFRGEEFVWYEARKPRSAALPVGKTA